jgi:hypothetical protein
MGTPTPEPTVVIQVDGAIKPMEEIRPEKQEIPRSFNLPRLFQKGVNIHDLGPVPADKIMAADQKASEEFPGIGPRPPRVGLKRTFKMAPLSIQRGSALETQLADGRKMWTLSIRSPGAFGIRLHFSKFDVGNGSVIVYAKTRDGLVIRGPYRKRS